jgi:hypothetical protein
MLVLNEAKKSTVETGRWLSTSKRRRPAGVQAEGTKHLYELMLDHEEEVERKRTKRDALTDVIPRFRHSERDEIERRYLNVKKAFWAALDEFKQIFARL